MTVNTTGPTGVSPSITSNFSTSLYSQCELVLASKIIYTAYTCFSIFLLFPLFILILCLGFQRWRRHPSGTVGNTDFFTFNMMFVEIVGVVGSAVYSLGNLIGSEALFMVGAILSSPIFPGQTLFHLLTCAERYLAVVHPIAYMHLREAVGVRIRNISSVFVWLTVFGWMGLTQNYYPEFPVICLFTLLSVCMCVMFVFCMSVLYVLLQPSPGDSGGTKQHVDQSKKRAFQMIVAIKGTLLLRFVGLLFWFGLLDIQSFNVTALCVFIDSGMWLMVPSSLVLPLLFLHRAGKLSCNSQSTKSG